MEGDIAVAQADYEQAKKEEEEQYEAMKIRIQYIYEKGETSYLQIFLEAESFSDMLNKAEYLEQLYEYDRKQLKLYQETRIAVEELQARLEEKKNILVTEKAELEANKKDLEDQKAYLDVLLAKKKRSLLILRHRSHRQGSRRRFIKRKSKRNKKRSKR